MNQSLSKIFCLIFLFLSSCVSRTYYQEVKFNLEPKKGDCIEFLTQKPLKESVRLGLISLQGSSMSVHGQLIYQAKNRAAAMGGDFIMAESQEVTSQTCTDPGRLTGNFSIWAYTPSQTGLRLNNSTVIGFHLNSDAPEAGVKVGDTLLGIEGYDLNDECLIEKRMNIFPGDKIRLNLIQDNKRVERVVTALPN